MSSKAYTLERDTQELSLLYRHPFRQRDSDEFDGPTDDCPLSVSSFVYRLLRYVKCML